MSSPMRLLVPSPDFKSEPKAASVNDPLKCKEQRGGIEPLGIRPDVLRREVRSFFQEHAA